MANRNCNKINWIEQNHQLLFACDESHYYCEMAECCSFGWIRSRRFENVCLFCVFRVCVNCDFNSYIGHGFTSKIWSHVANDAKNSKRSTFQIVCEYKIYNLSKIIISITQKFIQLKSSNFSRFFVYLCVCHDCEHLHASRSILSKTHLAQHFSHISKWFIASHRSSKSHQKVIFLCIQNILCVCVCINWKNK